MSIDSNLESNAAKTKANQALTVVIVGLGPLRRVVVNESLSIKPQWTPMAVREHLANKLRFGPGLSPTDEKWLQTSALATRTTILQEGVPLSVHEPMPDELLLLPPVSGG